MLIKRIKLEFLFLIALCATSQGIYAQALIEEKVCTVAYNKDKSAYISAQRRALPEVIELFRSANIKLSPFPTSTWARNFEMAKSGQCLIIGLWRNDKRDLLFNYSAAPLFTQSLALYVNNEMFLPEDKDIIMAVQRSSYIPEVLKNKRWKIHFVDTIEQSMKMLDAQRVHLIYGESAHLDYLISKNDYYVTKFEKVLPIIEHKEAYLAISKKHPNGAKLLNIFNHAITNTEIADEDEHKSLMKKD